ncbi:MAG: GTPase Era [Betaproteobacteria bacterium TMED82]|nr:MAG: GTPase Era [Betaproteobacteria bacterium TMED82]
MSDFKRGYVAIIGRPNVGKSTLLNKIVGDSVSIVSKKRQSTRNKVVGICTRQNYQIIFLDTPGLDFNKKFALNRRLNKLALAEVVSVDLIIWVTEANKFTDGDKFIKRLLPRNVPLIIALNKVDLSKNLYEKKKIFENSSNFMSLKPNALIPVSAKKNFQLNQLVNEVVKVIPFQEKIFEDDIKTNRSKTFRVSELIREIVMRYIGEELHYSLSVKIDKMEERSMGRTPLDIFATIYVGKKTHRPILLGSRGVKISKISEAARRELTQLLGVKVQLNLWVKVKKNWVKDTNLLLGMGID